MRTHLIRFFSTVITCTILLFAPSKVEADEWAWGPQEISYLHGHANLYVNEDGDLYVIGQGDLINYLYFDDEEWDSPILPSSYNGPVIKRIYISEGITAIGRKAFYGLKEIEMVTLPTSLMAIHKQAFLDCGIRCLNIPEGRNDKLYVLYEAFKGNRLKEVHLPSTFFASGNNIFDTEEPGARIHFTISEENPNYRISDGMLYNKEGVCLIECLAYGGTVSVPENVQLSEACFADKQIEEIFLPDGIERIPIRAFAGNSFREIIIPESVKEIESRAFENCDYLEEVILSDNLVSLGYNVFFNCKSLKKISLPDSIKEIEAGTFWGCTSLKEITIPSGVETIELDAFRGSGLQYIYIPETVSSLDANLFHICLENPDETDFNKQIWKIPDGFTICGKAGSYAEKYAKEHGITFVEARPLTKAAGLTFSLSQTTYNYANKAWRPVVTIKDGDYTLVQGVDYSVSYEDNTEVGTARVTVTGLDTYNDGRCYTGSKYFSYKINPRGTTITKLAAASKGFDVTIKKQATQTTGYQFRYSTSEDMTGAKTVTIADNTICRKQITKLKAKQKYYVQVRTYTIKDGKKYYSAWSQAKTVVTK